MCDGCTEPSASIATGRRLINLHEPLEQRFLFVERYSYARVDNFKPNASRSARLHTQGYTTLRREFERVIHQITEYML
jgi:hypothetical protein